jgi:hypothetical protein
MPRVVAFCTYNDYGKEKPALFPLSSSRIRPDGGEAVSVLAPKSSKVHVVQASENVRLVQLFLDGDLGIEVQAIEYANICHLVGQTGVPAPFLREGINIDWVLPIGARASVQVRNATDDQWLYIREAYFTVEPVE